MKLVHNSKFFKDLVPGDVLRFGSTQIDNAYLYMGKLRYCSLSTGFIYSLDARDVTSTTVYLVDLVVLIED